MSNTFDAGSIESRLVLDRSDFVDGLREAKAQGEDFAKQKYSAKLGIDKTAATLQLDEFKAQLDALKNVNLKIGVSGSSQKLNTLNTYATSLDGRDVTMSVQINGIADANAQLRTLRQQVNALDGHTINIRTDVDTTDAEARIAALRASLNGLNNTTTRVTAGNNSLSRSFGSINIGKMDAILTLGPALLPIAGYLTDIAGAAASLGAVTVAAVIPFAGALYGAINNVNGLNKTLTTAKKTLDTQKQALDKLTPGTKAYATQLEKVEQAQDAVNRANEAFSPTQKKFADGVTAMKGAWTGFIQATESVTLPVATTFVSALTDALPKAVPAVKAMAPEMQAIADSIKGWVSDGGFQRVIDIIIKDGIPAFHQLRLSAVDVITTLGNGFRAFLPQASTMADTIKRGADNMARWSNNGGFQTFINSVNQNAPQVKQFFNDLWTALLHVQQSLGPIGGLSLQFADALLKIVNALPPGVIQAMYIGFIAFRAALLGYAIAMGIASIATVTFETVSSPFFLLIAGAALTILAVVAALVALGVGIYELVKHWSTVQHGLVVAWDATWNAIKVSALAVWNSVLKPAFNGIVTAMHAVGTAAVWLWNNGLKQTFSAIETGAKLFVVILGTVLFTPLYLGFKLLRAAAMALWNNGLHTVFNWIIAGAKLWWDGVKLYFNFVITIIKTVGKWAAWLWNSAIKIAWNNIQTGTKTMRTIVSGAFDLFNKAMQTVGKWAGWLWRTGIKPEWDAISGAAKSLWNNYLKPYFNNVVAQFKTVGKWASWLWNNSIKPVWDHITSGTNTLKKNLVSAFNTMKDGIGKAWDGIKKVAAVPINFVIKNVYNDGIRKVWDGIANAVGLKGHNLPTAGLIKYAQGGAITGANVGMDTKAILARPGEHIWTAEEVAAAGGHGAVAQMRAQYAPTGTARVAPRNSNRYSSGGGILGGLSSLWDATGGKVASDVAGGAKALAGLVRGALGSALNPVLNALKTAGTAGINAVIPGSPQWQDLADGVVTKPIDWIKTFIAGDDKKYGGSVGGVVPKGQHLAIIDAALAAAGVPPPGTKAQWEAGMNTLIGRESGWNAGAINNWDSNAKAGHPSQGLTQTIPGTFAAYVPKALAHLGILNPIANVAASIRYIVSRYGNITKVQQANANKPPLGYFNGGLMAPGINLVGEKGPELVATSGNSRAFSTPETKKMLASSGAGGTVMVDLPDQVALTIDGQSFTAKMTVMTRKIVSTVIREAKRSK